MQQSQIKDLKKAIQAKASVMPSLMIFSTKTFRYLAVQAGMTEFEAYIFQDLMFLSTGGKLVHDEAWFE